MNKEEINLLKIQLLLEYYKNKDITKHYRTLIDSRIVFDNDILNDLTEPIYIIKFDKYKQLKNRIDKAIKYIEHNSPNLSNSEIYELLEILEGDNNE